MTGNKQNSAHLPTTMVLERTRVFSVSVLGGFKNGSFCGIAEETGAVAGFAAIVVMGTEAEFTKTGSVEGIGLPSFVCSFTT